MSENSDLERIQERLRQFRDDRDWAQFHTPENLAAAISVEAGELLEVFLWQDAPGVPPGRHKDVEDELADVLILCLSMANSIDVDAGTIIAAKLETNAGRYPIEQSRGAAHRPRPVVPELPREIGPHLEGIVGRTIPTLDRKSSNQVLAVIDGSVRVATARSALGQDIPLEEVQTGLDLLRAQGEVRVNVENLGYRSSFIGAVLGSVPGTVPLTNPVRVRKAEVNDLGDALEQILEATPKTRPRTFSATDPFARLVTQDGRAAVAWEVGDLPFIVEGSVGKGNWAETPWIALFDPLVTESAQQGYYVVYLFRPDGSGVYLSLNQGTTAVRNHFGRRYREVLTERGTTYGTYLEHHDLEGLIRGRIELEGSKTLTRGYESGNVAARFYESGALPSNSELAGDLHRLLDLYGALEEALDELDSETAPDASRETVTGKEARRYRWHLRAEGRNRRVVREAKRIQGSTCRVCEVDPVEQFGELGRRCVEAHHLTPFADLDDRPRKLDPRRDFAIVCSNCHRMLHSQTPPLTPNDLQTLLQ